MIKRAIDIIASSIGLLILSPVFGVIAWLINAILLDQFFIKDQGSAKMVLYSKSSSFAPCMKSPKVMRVREYPPRTICGSKLGRWLRETKINEFPQLINVLLGEMSLVGPRPEDPEITATWPEDVKKEILSARPGVTSPASVLFRNEEAILATDHVMDTYLESIVPSKLRLDQLYVRNHSLLLDIDTSFLDISGSAAASHFICTS